MLPPRPDQNPMRTIMRRWFAIIVLFGIGVGLFFAFVSTVAKPPAKPPLIQTRLAT